MFSDVRLENCSVQAFETNAAGTEAPVSILNRVAPPWKSLMQRKRRAVIDAFIDHTCKRPQIRHVRVSTVCEGNEETFEKDCEDPP